MLEVLPRIRARLERRAVSGGYGRLSVADVVSTVRSVRACCELSAADGPFFLTMTTLPEVEHAENLLLELSKEKETWSPKELRQQARNGVPVQVISLAFWRLLNRRELILDDDLQVRRASSEASSCATTARHARSRGERAAARRIGGE
jgi:hypothetical protein